MVTDERVERVSGASPGVASRVPIVGSVAELLRDPSLEVTLYCRPCPVDQQAHAMPVQPNVHVRHAGDWHGLDIVTKWPKILGDLLHLEPHDVSIVILPTSLGLLWTMSHFASRQARAGRTIVLNRGYLADSILVRGGLKTRLLLPVPLRFAQALTRWANARADACVVVSRQLACDMHNPEAYICPEVDWQALEAVRAAIPSSRSRQVLFAGRLEPEKSPRLALEAFLRSGLGASGYRFLVAGDGSQRDELMHLAADHEGLCFLGAVPHQELLQLMARTDIVIVPSETEAFGLVALEGAALGAKVVAARVGGMPEALRAGGGGILVDGRDVQIWSNALAEAAELPRNEPLNRPIGPEQGSGWQTLAQVVEHLFSRNGSRSRDD